MQFPVRISRNIPQFGFIKYRKLGYAISASLILAAIIGLLVLKLNFGIDFVGGSIIEVRTAEPHQTANLRKALADLELGDISLQEFGHPQDIMIRVPLQEGGESAQKAAIDKIQASLGESVEIRRVEFVGPQVGDELKRSGLIAIGLSLFSIMIYVWFRFEWHYGLCAIIALFHDVLATMGLFSFLQIEFNLSSLAAILTVAGYSINDTVVIFDRVRENLRKYKTTAIPDVLNMSLNETLSRTFLTSFTTLLAVASLYVFGGEVLRGFSLALIWGVVIGTFSTVFVATPLLLFFNLRLHLEDENTP